MHHYMMLLLMREVEGVNQIHSLIMHDGIHYSNKLNESS